MTTTSRDSALRLIESNIARRGRHIYTVSGAPLPRFVYTIGVSQQFGAELVLAGASIYTANEAMCITSAIAGSLSADVDLDQDVFEVESLGRFSLRSVDVSWSSCLLLGALDFYGVSAVRAMQIVPDDEHWTIDVPDLSRPWSAEAEPVWQWLHRSWTEVVSPESVAVTNLRALRGEQVTEAARWEADQWELFVGPGPDVASEDARVVPLGTLLARDESLREVVRLEVGQALWRESKEMGWQKWK